MNISDLNTLGSLYINNSEKIRSFIECVDKVKSLRERKFPYIPHVTLKSHGIEEEDLDSFIYFCGMCNQPIELFEKGYKFL